MISFETARKLKEAGLYKLLCIGDWIYFDKEEVERVEKIHGYNHSPELWQKPTPLDLDDVERMDEPEDEHDLKLSLAIFAPRLDQLLSEIEKQSGRYKYELTGSRVYPLSNNLKPKYRITIQTDRVLPFFADSPEEATAEALIWILEQEGQNVTSDI